MKKEKDKITKRLHSSQFNLIESCLQDYARKGLIPENYEMGEFIFKQCTPTNRRYRVLTSVFSSREKEIVKFEQKGWIHFPTGLGNQILYTDDVSVPELYEDKKEYV